MHLALVERGKEGEVIVREQVFAPLLLQVDGAPACQPGEEAVMLAIERLHRLNKTLLGRVDEHATICVQLRAAIQHQCLERSVCGLCHARQDVGDFAKLVFDRGELVEDAVLQLFQRADLQFLDLLKRGLFGVNGASLA